MNNAIEITVGAAVHGDGGFVGEVERMEFEEFPRADGRDR